MEERAPVQPARAVPEPAPAPAATPAHSASPKPPTTSPPAASSGAVWLAPRWPFALATGVGMVVAALTLAVGGNIGDYVCVVGALALHNFVWAVFASWAGSRKGRRLEAELLAFALGPIGLGLALILQPSAEHVWKKAALEAAKRGEVAPSRGEDPPPGTAGWWMLAIGAVIAVLIVGVGPSVSQSAASSDPIPVPSSRAASEAEEAERVEHVIEEIRAKRRAEEEGAAAAAPPRCLPQYVGGCVPAPPPDLDCKDIGHPITVLGEDVHRLDRDGDGRACEGKR